MWRTENLVPSIFGTPLNGAKLLCRISSGKFFSEAALVSRRTVVVAGITGPRCFCNVSARFARRDTLLREIHDV